MPQELTGTVLTVFKSRCKKATSLSQQNLVLGANRKPLENGSANRDYLSPPG
jgi:hypothetical protein